MSTKTTSKIKWRLGNLPTPDEVRELVKDDILTKDEAREILFSLETQEDRDGKALETEIRFLRDLVEKLSSTRSHIVETIKYVEKPYYQQQWFQPYQVYCTNEALPGQMYTSSNSSTQGISLSYSTTPAFTSIKTF